MLHKSQNGSHSVETFNSNYFSLMPLVVASVDSVPSRQERNETSIWQGILLSSLAHSLSSSPCTMPFTAPKALRCAHCADRFKVCFLLCSIQKLQPESEPHSASYWAYTQQGSDCLRQKTDSKLEKGNTVIAILQMENRLVSHRLSDMSKKFCGRVKN